MTGSTTAALLAAAALGTVLWGEPALAGWPTQDVAAGLLYGAAALWLTGWAVERARPSIPDALGAVAMWAIFVASLTAVYANRDAAFATLRDFAGEIGSGSGAAVVSEGGEVTLVRRRDGHFRFEALVNERSAPFVFDTGASSVVLTAETAELMGLKASDLRFVVPVQTANGRSLTAPVVIDRLAIGSLVFTRVPALVARPGLLVDNLLGQTVLNRLDSYEVRGNRLVLRARKG